MRYTKCHFQLSPCEEAYSDLLSSLLGAVGFDSFESTSEGVDGYVQSSEFSKEAVDEVVSSFPISHVDISYTTEEMADTDWNSSWESAFEPIRISDLAYTVGFNDPKYFSICFKKEFGMQPSEYIERYANKIGDDSKNADEADK